jgi:hypothetical protein
MYNTMYRHRHVEEGYHNQLGFVQRFNIIPNPNRFSYPIVTVVHKLSPRSQLHPFWQQVQLWSEHDSIYQKIQRYNIHVSHQRLLKRPDGFFKAKRLCNVHRCYSKIRFTFKTSYSFEVLSIATTLNVKKSLRSVLYFFAYFDNEKANARM